MRLTFIDEVTINVRSGAGGAGCVSFRREKFVPFGGPDGGNGGRGGDLIAVANPQLGTLLDYKFHSRYAAEAGKGGEGGNRSGRDGESLRLQLPVGTQV